jgi:prophage regulatory protein
MRIVSKRQLKELVLYSPQHIARLERAGQFPKRVHLGPARVRSVEAEVLDWLQKLLDCREAPRRHSFTIGKTSSFLDRRKVANAARTRYRVRLAWE